MSAVFYVLAFFMGFFVAVLLFVIDKTRAVFYSFLDKAKNGQDGESEVDDGSKKLIVSADKENTCPEAPSFLGQDGAHDASFYPQGDARVLETKDAVILYLSYKELYRLFRESPLKSTGEGFCRTAEKDYFVLYKYGATAIFDMGTEACALFEGREAGLMACRAAIEIQRAEGRKIFPSIGISSGRILIAGVDTLHGKNLKAMGEDVFFAGELAHAATERNIILSRDFYSGLKNVLIAEGPQNLKHRDRDGFNRVFILKEVCGDSYDR